MIKIRFIPADCWVGLYYDSRKRRIWACPLPMVALRFDLATRDAIDRYVAARFLLNENGIAEAATGCRDETPEFHRLNHEVAEAERGLSWLRIWWIDSRMLAAENYWERLDAALRAGGLA
jgi:hypothetical protein